VAYCGMIAFIGLGAPHLSRALFGKRLLNRPALFLLLSSLAGGLLLLFSDTLARRLLWPSELPVGVVTAIAGGLYLLFFVCAPTTNDLMALLRDDS
jgi:iron complex transport system permease protein